MIQYPHVATGLMAGQPTELPDPKEPEPILPGGKFFMGPGKETEHVPPDLSVELIAYEGTKVVDNKNVPIYVGEKGTDADVQEANITNVLSYYNFKIEQKLFVYFKIPEDQHPGTYEVRIKDGTFVLATDYVKVLTIVQFEAIG